MITVRTMRPDELDAWCAHCGSVFSADGSDYFRRHYAFDPLADPGLVFLAEDAGEIASTLRVFIRRIWLGGRAVDMGGIGEVGTKAAWRRQGLAARLLEMAIAAMSARGMPVSMLFGDQAIYRRAGWVFCPAGFTVARAAALDALPETAAVRPFAPPDLDAVMGAYDLYAGRVDGALLRSDAYWRSWVLPQWKAPRVLLLGGRVQGYACAEKDGAGSELHVRELAMTPQAEPCLPGFLRRLAQEAGCERLRVSTPMAKDLPGLRYENPTFIMVRLNLPLEGIDSSEALAEAMPNAGICAVDVF